MTEHNHGLLTAVRAHAHTVLGKRLHWLDQAGDVVTSWSYAELWRAVQAIATFLQAQDLAGRNVLLCMDSGPEFAACFLGCLQARVAAVPVHFGERLAFLQRIKRIAVDCQPSLILTRLKDLPNSDQLESVPELAQVPWVPFDVLQESIAASGVAEAEKVDASEPPPDMVAFLQYTSGSTGRPKGVQVTHGALNANLRMIFERFSLSKDDVYFSWLPQFHDMGLVGGILSPLRLGAVNYLAPTSWFVRRPTRWLQAVSRYRVTVSGAPNFAYELCCRRPIPPDLLNSLDLSCWTLAFSGAEPVRASTLTRFSQALEGTGFSPAAFLPCYGLAEATLMVTSAERTRPAAIRQLDGESYSQGVVREAPPQHASSVSSVSCGAPPTGLEIICVDPNTRLPVPAGKIGEVWVSGACVAKGYFGQPEETERTFSAYLAQVREGHPCGPYLRTGDKGFVLDGELHVAGRIKDLIIIRGRNYHPQDLEHTVRQADGRLTSVGVAFTEHRDGDDLLVIAQESAKIPDHEAEALVRRIRSALSEHYGLSLGRLLLVRRRSLPMTTSGKVRRFAVKEHCAASHLDVHLEWTEAGGFTQVRGSRPESSAQHGEQV